MFALRKVIPRRAKQSGWALVRQFRRLTSFLRPLPEFIVIGAQKSGTSSLYSYLGQHPHLMPSFAKEIHFFDGGLDPKIDTYEKGLSWYRSQFPIKYGNRGDCKAYEATPLYLFNPLVAQRIFQHAPSARLIAVLRNPTERAISHYFHEKHWGHEHLPIVQALRQEEERLRPVLETNDYKSDAFIHHAYKARGLYKEQLERYLEYFPLQQMLILSSEELFGEPTRILRQIYEFVGVDTGFQIPDMHARNVASNKESVDAEIYSYLDEFYAPHNQALYELLGRDFSW